MADKKISALTSATTPLAGTEVLPIVQSNVTVKVASDDLTVRNIRANATTGILQVTGPAAASTRVATVPDANFTVARTDAAQTFTGTQTFSAGITGASGFQISGFSAYRASGASTSSPRCTAALLLWQGLSTPRPEYLWAASSLPACRSRSWPLS